MSGLVPHLQQALRAQAKLAAVGPERAIDLPQRWRRSGTESSLSESACRVSHLNSAAEHILCCRDGIHIRSGRIAATAAQAERRLNRALHAALNDDGSISLWSIVPLRKALGQTALRHSRTATSPRPHRRNSNDATALVLVIDPEHEPEPARRTVEAALQFYQYGSRNRSALTPGRDPKQVSEELSVSAMDSSHPLTAPIRQNRHTPPSRTHSNLLAISQ